MNTEDKYWLYLEPYSFLFSGSNGAFIYNTLNGEIVDVPVNLDYIQSIIVGLSDPANGYCIPVESSFLEQQEVLEFLRKLRNSFSGDIINAINTKPFIIPPACHIVETKERMMKDHESSSRRYIMDNLSEISLFFPSNGSINSCNSKLEYACQFLHCSDFPGEPLDYSYYHQLFQKIKPLKIGIINILCEDIWKYQDWMLLCTDLRVLDVKKVFYLEYSENLNWDDVYKLQIDDNTNVVIYIHSPYDKGNLMKCIDNSKDKDIKIEWAFVLRSEHDLDRANEIASSRDFEMSMHPLIVDGNINFFEEYVYNSYEDIMEYPVSKQVIFRRQTLNENFFGKLFILPSGEVYANLNCKPLGNIREHSLNEMVYNEMIDSTAWFMTRDRGICKDCAYKYLCPSISNYELASGKINMCHVRE